MPSICASSLIPKDEALSSVPQLTGKLPEFFEDKLVAGLKAALPVDAFFFDLHGAGQDENVPDSEGHLLRWAR